MFGNVFKSRANYVLDYKPRFYDARKERLENLKKKYANKDFNQKEYKISLTKDNLRTDWNRTKRIAHDRKINLRLALIIAILFGIFSFLFLDIKLF